MKITMRLNPMVSIGMCLLALGALEGCSPGTPSSGSSQPTTLQAGISDPGSGPTSQSTDEFLQDEVTRLKALNTSESYALRDDDLLFLEQEGVLQAGDRTAFSPLVR